MARLRRTPMQELFFKQIQRLRRAISREYRKTGVELDRNLIPEMPKRVTKKQLENIKDIKPRDLRRETTYYDPEDLDREITYEEAKRIWNEEQREVPIMPQIDFDKNFIPQFRESYAGYNRPFVAEMDSWLGNLINKYGEEKVGKMLEKGMQNGVIVTREVAYDAAKMHEFQSKMLAYLEMDKETQAKVLSASERDSYTEPE